MKYLLSIIIPTKNRQRYCINAIKQILSMGWSNVEICIQDNSDDNELEREISSLGVNTIFYNYHSGVLSFVDNFSEAVSLAHGDYLCMIGDDDGILPDIMTLVEDMNSQNADAAIPALNFIYFWPSDQRIVDDGDKGVLFSHLYNEHIIQRGKQVDCNKAIRTLLKNGVQNYTSLDLPRLYHGIVKRDVLNIILNKTGSYFGGLTPDIYMAAALSLVCQKVIRVKYSITISGICPTSGSSDSATGKHTGELKQAPHFRGHDKYTWEELIPAFYSVDTIWADTLLHALKDFGRTDLVKLFNMSLFDGICIERYPEYSNLILTHALSNKCTIREIKFSLLINKINALIGKIHDRIMRKLNRGIGSSITRSYEIPDINSAEFKIRTIKGIS